MRLSLFVLCLLLAAFTFVYSIEVSHCPPDSATESCLCHFCEDEDDMDLTSCASECNSFCVDPLCELCKKGAIADFDECWSGCEPPFYLPSGKAMSKQLFDFKVATGYAFIFPDSAFDSLSDAKIKIVGLSVFQALGNDVKTTSGLTPPAAWTDDLDFTEFKVTLGKPELTGLTNSEFLSGTSTWSNAIASGTEQLVKSGKHSLKNADAFGATTEVKNPGWFKLVDFDAPFFFSAEDDTTGLIIQIEHDAATASNAGSVSATPIPDIYLAAKNVYSRTGLAYEATKRDVSGDLVITHQQVQFKIHYEIFDEEDSCEEDKKRKESKNIEAVVA